MSRTDELGIRDAITAFVQTRLAHDPDSDIGPDVEVVETGVVDSLGAMRLVAFIEQSYGVDVPPQDVTVENFGTIRDMARYVCLRAGRSRHDVGS